MLLCVLLLIGFIDYQQRRIPNGLLILLLGVVLFNHYTRPQVDGDQWLINIVLALVLTAPGYIKGVMGAGDVKLLLVSSAVWPPIVFLLVFSAGILLLSAVMYTPKLVGKFRAAVPTHSGTVNINPTEGSIDRGLPVGTAVFLGATLFTAASFIS